jgi:hypothetical protein
MWYAGAVQGKIKYDYRDETGTGEQMTVQSEPTQKMSMKDAMGRYGDNLDALNYESESAMGGTLFERVTVPAEN